MRHAWRASIANDVTEAKTSLKFWRAHLLPRYPTATTSKRNRPSRADHPARTRPFSRAHTERPVGETSGSATPVSPSPRSPAQELEKYPKWTTRPVSHKKQKKTSYASPGTTSNDEEFRVCTDSLEKEKRPPGAKYEKEKRSISHVSDDSGCKLSLENVWAQKIEKDDVKEAAKNAHYARAFELQEKQIALQEREDARQETEAARKQFELDEKIMLVDTSGMSVAQKQFYNDKQNEIMARRHQ
uniref:Uncharacterized protein n=1 Tax=Avena sativa TaxID=4498 RepID=A0ACD5XP62_AVESA